MSKLGFLKWKRKASGKDGVGKDATQPSISIEKIRPKTTHQLGTAISFCIENHSMQMAAVRHWGKSKRLLDIKKEYFPKDSTGQKSRNEIILREITDFIADNSGYATTVSLAVSGPETTFRTFLMPKLRRGELETAVSFEVKKQIPFPFEDCTYDYRPIYRISREGSESYKVALQAATKRFIREQLEPFEFQDLNVSNIYHSQDVIGEFLKHLAGFTEGKSYTLLNIGLKSTEISFYKGATLEFSHATAVSSAMLGTFPEQTRYEYFAETIANEIQTSLDYYAGQYSASLQEKIYVYGDLASSEELLQLLNTKSGIELEPLPVSTLCGLGTRDNDQIDIIPVCLPALAAASCHVSLANLLPADQKRSRAQGKTGIYARVAVVLIVLALGLSWLTLRNRTNIAEKKLLELNRQVVEFRNSEAFHTYNLVKRQIALDQSYLDQIKQSPSYLALNLKELTRLTPDPITLLYLDYTPDPVEKNIYLHGIVESKEIPPEIILAEYVEVLSDSPFYEDVSIVRHVKKAIKNKFQIDFQIQLRGAV
ncbi:MAG: pilus assembly protein PilM [Candidatus Zixiibacteriota bacterium]|nr:MAG: pilus assembly protein PilM [candidate division Zixibacteria bacterium]